MVSIFKHRSYLLISGIFEFKKDYIIKESLTLSHVSAFNLNGVIVHGAMFVILSKIFRMFLKQRGNF